MHNLNNEETKKEEANGISNGTLIYDPCEIEDSYFGGRLKFRTKIVWPNAIFFLTIHLLGLYGLWLGFCQLIEFRFLTTLYAYMLGFIGGEGVTIGAHRLWCHRSFKARRPLRVILILGQTLAGQNCCYKWVKEHRQHHKYSDTAADPHDASRGLFYSHCGWLMMRRHPEVKEKAKAIYMEDIEKDPVVMFQKKHFKKLFFLFGVLIPVAIPVLFWNESIWTSTMLAFFGRYIFLLNVTWTVNSLAHFFGNRPYDKSLYPSENTFVSFIGYGEGWHNYHHSFPWDYKASEFGKHFNFTRDLIEFFARIGWAYDLKEASDEIIDKRMKRCGDGTPKYNRPSTVEIKECMSIKPRELINNYLGTS